MSKTSNSPTDPPSSDDDNDDDEQERVSFPSTTSVSPTRSRRLQPTRSFSSLTRHIPTRLIMENAADEQTPLLGREESKNRYTRSTPATPRSRVLSRQQSVSGSFIKSKNLSRTPSWFMSGGLHTSRTMQSSVGSFKDKRMWYDQFTSTDWVHDSIADGFRIHELQKRKDIRGRLWLWFDSIQGWILMGIIGSLTAIVAYLVDVTESFVFDLKEGYCSPAWYLNNAKCVAHGGVRGHWVTWAETFRPLQTDNWWIDYLVFVVSSFLLALAACYVTLFSQTVVPSHIAATLDENLGAPKRRKSNEDNVIADTPKDAFEDVSPPMVYYSAAGSGVAEVRVILSGFVLHGYLGVKTLFIKTLALILSIASGMSIGKEGPYVHIATCIGNICCRLFSKYNLNDGKRREVLSASAASGVAVAFGAPIGGVLFSLEEVSYYFSPKCLFRTFFCCIAAALSLKFLNPYGTSKIVLFEVRYVIDWRFFELFIFILLGVAGGFLGALFIKASRLWATTFRRIHLIKTYPMLEVALVALVTGLVSFWNRYTKLPVAELLFELASPCHPELNTGLCPTREGIPNVIRYLTIAFIIKAFLTTVTFGIKVPAGIYVPSMVVGGLMGRIVGHITQYVVLEHPNLSIFANCPNTPGIEACVTPGVYALIAAGATMCGVTRLSITLAIILFELTGSLEHVLPFSLAVLVAKWTAEAVEPLSIYDLLTDMNSYPFLDNKVHPVFDNETSLGDITRKARKSRTIDISTSSLVRATELREKLIAVQSAGELDGGLPIVRHGALVGLIPAPDLEFALDRIDDEDTADCLMSGSSDRQTNQAWREAFNESADDEGGESDPTDLTPIIDPSPVALDIHSPMDLVYQCFVKLGLRYICVVRQGRFVGLVHKKAFVRYIKELEEKSR